MKSYATVLSFPIYFLKIPDIMKFWESPKDIHIEAINEGENCRFTIFVRNISFDREFRDSCVEFFDYAFNLDVSDGNDENEFMKGRLILSQARPSPAFDKAFEITVFNIDDCDRFKETIMEFVHAMNIDGQVVHGILIDEEEYMKRLNDMMDMDMELDDSSFCPEPEDLSIDDECVHFKQDRTLKSMNVIRIGDDVYIQNRVGNDDVVIKLT